MQLLLVIHEPCVPAPSSPWRDPCLLSTVCIYLSQFCRLPHIKLFNSLPQELRLQPLPLSLNLSFQISLPAMAASSSRMGSSSSSSGSNSTGISWSLQFHLSLTSSEENSLDPKTTRPNYMKVYHQQPPLVQIVGFKLPTPSASTRSRPVSLHQVGRHPIVMLQLWVEMV